MGTTTRTDWGSPRHAEKNPRQASSPQVKVEVFVTIYNPFMRKLFFLAMYPENGRSLLKAFRVDRYTRQHDSDSWDPRTRYLHTVDRPTNTAMSDEIHKLVSGHP